MNLKMCRVNPFCLLIEEPARLRRLSVVELLGFSEG